MSATLPFEMSAGHVGPPVSCNMVKLFDVPELGYVASKGKGEICVKGANCVRGYFKDPGICMLKIPLYFPAIFPSFIITFSLFHTGFVTPFAFSPLRFIFLQSFFQKHFVKMLACEIHSD